MTESTVDVAVRIRPLVSYEMENGSKPCVSVVPGKQKIQIRDTEQLFRFHHVFGSEADNDKFYNSAVRNKITEVFNERDVTIFAYGHRSSGKTHTMGTNYTGEKNMGIIPLALNTIFDIIDSSIDKIYNVTVAFVELYNKELYDLLAPKKIQVEIKSDESKILGLTEKQVTSAKDALEYLVKGSQERATSEKTYNSQSNRSHAIFTISIKQRKNVDPRIITTSKLHLIDLAGPKHGKKCGKNAKRNINKDILAVGNLLNQLRKGKSDTYAKYHDNKLVILLRDSLLGKSMTLFIACVSPADFCLTETLDTLKYASRLRKMKRDVVEDLNEVSREIYRNLVTARPNLINVAEESFFMSQDIPEMIQGETDNDSETEFKSEQKGVQSESDEDMLGEKIQDTLQSNKSSKPEQEKAQDEMSEDTNSESVQDVVQTNKTSKYEREAVRSKTEEKKSQSETNEAKVDEMQNIPESCKSSKTDDEPVSRKKSDETPSEFFLKIADLILEPSESEQKELQREIRVFRKKLRDRTDKLKKNFMDVVSIRMELSEDKRRSMKILVAKILEEFHDVLASLAETSEIQDWILRVYRRIDELLLEQKKVAWKMVKCEMAKDETMIEKYAEHTMRQMERYHELQGVNRCIAMLGELVVSLLKTPTTVSVDELVRNFEDTKNKIEALENEKIDLVHVLKNAEWNNESRRLSEFGIGKSLQLDEKISKLWRKRIRQMMAIEKKEKFDQQIANMSAQIEKLKSEKVRIEGEMMNAEKQWKRTIASAKQKQRREKIVTKKAKENSMVSGRCGCKTNCLSRRCGCVRNGLSCINCNCNAELCQNSDKTNDITEMRFIESQVSERSTDGKMEIDYAAGRSSVDSCMCHKNRASCTNCNRGFKLHEYKEKGKARRRLFTDIVLPHENKDNELPRKRPRLVA